MGGFDPGVQTYDPFDDRAVFTLQYCIWPRRCYITGRWLFCTLAMHGRRTITGPGDPVYEDRWYHRDEHLIMLLKKA
jgi:hypothetical protein